MKDWQKILTGVAITMLLGVITVFVMYWIVLVALEVVA